MTKCATLVVRYRTHPLAYIDARASQTERTCGRAVGGVNLRIAHASTSLRAYTAGTLSRERNDRRRYVRAEASRTRKRGDFVIRHNFDRRISRTVPSARASGPCGARPTPPRVSPAISCPSCHSSRKSGAISTRYACACSMTGRARRSNAWSAISTADSRTSNISLTCRSIAYAFERSSDSKRVCHRPLSGKSHSNASASASSRGSPKCVDMRSSSALGSSPSACRY